MLKQRSEQIDDIIERIPTKFGIWVTGIILSIFMSLLLFTWLIQYPDTVSGNITIRSQYAPIKLVANSSGKLSLFNFKSKSVLQSGDYIAIIQNSANTNDVKLIKQLLDKFDIKTFGLDLINSLPRNASMGEINVKYYNFLLALKKYSDYNQGNLFKKQTNGLKTKIEQLLTSKMNTELLKLTRTKNMAIYYKAHIKDSLLLLNKNATELEFDRSQLSYLNSKESVQSTNNELNNTQQLIDEYQNSLQRLIIEKDVEESKIKLELLTAYADLKDNIDSWERRYVFKAPISGKLDFSKFWNNNDFIQSGEVVFTIVPKLNKLIGQVQLPSYGAGKVKIGQEVAIKLESYPYEEYGIVTGFVNTISLSTNETKENGQSIINTYLVEIRLPKNLNTNYGFNIKFASEIKGTVDIICSKRNLLSRFFDNLRRITSKDK